MATNQPNIISKPDEQIDASGRIPAEIYTCRFVNGKRHTSGKDFLNIEAGAEIVMPDRVQLPDGRWCGNIAAKKFTVYITIDEGSAQYQKWYGALGRLELLDKDGNVNIDDIIETLKSGKLYFFVALDSEERVMRYPPGPGERFGKPMKHPVTGDDLKGGWQIKYVSPEQIIQRTTVDMNAPLVQAAENRPY